MAAYIANPLNAAAQPAPWKPPARPGDDPEARRLRARAKTRARGLALAVGALATPPLSPEDQWRSRRLAVLGPRLHVVCALLALFGVVTGIVEAQVMFWRCNLEPQATMADCPARLRDPLTDALKAATTASTALLLLAICAAKGVEAAELRLHGELLPGETVFSTLLPLRLAAELLVCGVHCPAGVYRTVTVQNFTAAITYDLDALLSILLLARLYLVLIAAVEVAGLRSSQVKVIERFNGVPLQAGFTLRSMLYRAPLSTTACLFAVVMLSEAYAMHVAERPMCHTDDAAESGWCGPGTMGTKDFASFSVSLWNIVSV